jgi:hypothetical protein
VEPCIDGWNWGYTYKANVNNPSQLSCHASGTAIDWNAPDHPNGSSGTFTNSQVTTIYTILAEVEGAVSWLQGYDEMHFEICVSAGTLAGVAARLGTNQEDDMPLNDADKKWITDAIKGNNGALTDAVWNEVMPSNADGRNPEKSEPGRKARDTMSTIMTILSRMYR